MWTSPLFLWLFPNYCLTNQLMMYKARVLVYSAIRTEHSTQSEHHVEFKR
jgi:hypothetical protein